MKRRADPRHRQRGVAAVEFALVLPLLLTLVLAAIDWGWFFFIDQQVANCAREGARAGTLLPPRPASTTTAAATAAHDASVAFLSAVHLNPNPQFVVATYTTIGGSDAIQVVVTYPVGSLTGLLSNMMPANSHATAVMRWQ
jgi:Flp pilus assembly protein TadG